MVFRDTLHIEHESCKGNSLQKTCAKLSASVVQRTWNFLSYLDF